MSVKSTLSYRKLYHLPFSYKINYSHQTIFHEKLCSPTPQELLLIFQFLNHTRSPHQPNFKLLLYRFFVPAGYNGIKKPSNLIEFAPYEYNVKSN